MTTLLTDVAWISLSTGTALLVVAAVMRYRRNRAVKKRLAELDRLDTANAQVNMWGPAGGIFGDLSGVDSLMDQMDGDIADVYEQLGKARRYWKWRHRLEALNPWANRRRLREQVRRLESDLANSERRVDNYANELRMMRDTLRTSGMSIMVDIEEVSEGGDVVMIRWPHGIPLPYVNGVIDLPDIIRSEHRRKDITESARKVRSVFRVHDVVPWIHGVTREVRLRVRGQVELRIETLPQTP